RDADGIGGTVYGGYNMQSGSIVYGAEADISYAGEDGSAGSQAPVGTLKGTQGVNGSVRGRVGYDLNPFLVYGTAGLAVANHELSGAGTDDEKLAAGYTVGAGVETFVTDNITARVEYRYSDYQKRDFNLGGSTVSRGFDDHSVKVGMGVKF
ncbi:MAG: porin family protein, partial [Alphaproteobacteria bacterium]|nr:porin family protein [Alphaproteobacteria bacterium]